MSKQQTIIQVIIRYKHLSDKKQHNVIIEISTDCQTQMQLIAQRLAKTFQDINKQLTMQIRKKEKPSILQENGNEEPISVESDKKIDKEVGTVREEINSYCKFIVEIEPPQQKKQSKKVKKSTVQRPKKPQNSFRLFLNEMKKQPINNDDPDFQNQITKIANKKWQNMSLEDKKPYLQLQQKQNMNYKKNLQYFYSIYPEQKNKDQEREELKKIKRKEKQQEKLKQKQKDKEKEKDKDKDKDKEKEKDKDKDEDRIDQILQNQTKNKEMQKIRDKQRKQKNKDHESQLKRKTSKTKQKTKINQIEFQQFTQVNKYPGNENQHLQRISKQEQTLNFSIPIQFSIDSRQLQREIGNKQITQKFTIDEVVEKPDIGQYFNLNDSSDSLGRDI